MRGLFRRQEPHDDQDNRDHLESLDNDNMGSYDDLPPLDNANHSGDYDTGYDSYSDFADDQEPDIEPFVPVSRNTQTATVDPPAERRRIRPRLPRVKLPGLNVDLDWSYFLLALFLFAAGVFGVLLKQGNLARDVEAWWPLAMVIVGVLWMFIALVRRQVASFLGGSAFAGLGLSLLLETQDIAAVEETMLGVVLVTVGLGIVMRGFLLRQQVS